MGREEKEEREGIAETFSLLTEFTFRPVVERVDMLGQLLFSEGRTAFNDGDYEASLAELARSRPYLSTHMRLVYQRDSGQRLAEDYVFDSDEALIIAEELADFVLSQERLRESFLYEQLAAQVPVSEALAAIQSPPERELWEIILQDFGISATALHSLGQQWEAYRERLAPVESRAEAEAFVAVATIGRRLGVLISDYERVLALSLDDVESRFEEEKEKLINGETVAVSDTEGEGEEPAGRIVRYPDRRIAELRSIDGELLDWIGDIGVFLEEWTPDADLGALDTAIPAAIDRVFDLEDRAEAMAEEVARQIAFAQQEILLAERFRREGESHYATALAEFDRESFDEARFAITEASEALDNSLERQEDPELTRLREEVFPAFLTLVTNTENAIVVAEVRALINAASSDYRNGEFDKAESALLRAQSRWLDTNTSDNDEILDWLTLVRQAKDLQEGWDIDETEARYVEMTQYLKFASEDFQLALDLERTGDGMAAGDSFREALEILDRIEIPYPHWQDANILRLQIRRLLEPGVFITDMSLVKSQASDAIRASDRIELQDTYRLLREYSTVMPGDQELLSLIDSAEIALGIRLRPPSQQEISQSQEKYQSALDIWQQGLRDLYDDAIALLNDAIKLWSGNQEALQLKDRILVGTGATRRDLISRDDAKKLETAEQLFSEKRYIESANIILSLWKNESNRSYPPLLDLLEKLKKRVDIDV
jgi:hypothetical protein